MCYATKRKIADCVKVLMRRKDISKITIQDIMHATNMSRQSFYYHFKDIYDVLEWIELNDFKDQLEGENYDSMEVWVSDLMKVLRQENAFYEKLVREVEWPCIVRWMKSAISEQVHRLLLLENQAVFEQNPEALDGCVEFLSLSICYYMIDYAYHRKHLSDEKMEKDIRFMMKMLGGQQKATTILFPNAVVI